VCYHAEISALLHVDSDCKSIIQSSQIKQTFLQFNERHGVVGMRLYWPHTQIEAWGQTDTLWRLLQVCGSLQGPRFYPVDPLLYGPTGFQEGRMSVNGHGDQVILIG